MSHNPYLKHQASISIEEVPDYPANRQQSWLLTYIDVFVLIIMLVLTLLALSDFDSEPKKIKQNNLTEIVEHKPTKKIKPLVISSEPPLPTIELVEQTLIDYSTTVAPKLVESIQKSIDSTEEMLQKDNQTPINEEDLTVITKNTTEITPKTIIEEQARLINDKKSNNITLENNNSLQTQLQKTIDELGLTDAINMKVSLGYAQLEIQDKVLFQSSESNLLVAGETLLKKLAPLLIKSSGLIYIEGHTDNRPIKTQRFPSNWELGSSRATSVLHFLSSQKLDTSRMRAVTYADTKPIEDNETEHGREKNRRVSLVIKVSDKIN
jgi:chemotaxis protein MotB